MNKRIEIAPAIMPDSFEQLKREAEGIAAYAQSAQVDIMDGAFVPPISWPYGEGQWDELEHSTLATHIPQIELEAHLMVDDPENIGMRFIQAGARRVVAHIETLGHTNDAQNTFSMWKRAGAEVGVSLLLDTPLSEIAGLVADVDYVQVMSIAKIGYQGEPFDERAIERIQEVRRAHPLLTISVDGGVSVDNAPALVRAGANRLAVGSAVVKQANPQEAYKKLCYTVENL